MVNIMQLLIKMGKIVITRRIQKIWEIKFANHLYILVHKTTVC